MLVLQRSDRKYDHNSWYIHCFSPTKRPKGQHLPYSLFFLPRCRRKLQFVHERRAFDRSPRGFKIERRSVNQSTTRCYTSYSKGRIVNTVVSRSSLNLSRFFILIIELQDGRTKLTLEDLGSKTGTYVNDSPSRIGHGTTVVLKVGDKIKFGTVRNVWTWVQSP